MIRPFTCVCVLAFIGSGLYLYQTKHRAQMLDRDIARTIKTTESVRDRIGVLRGEWALLNEPERLAELSQQHLGLRTLAPTQFVAFADLGARMPAVLPAGSMLTPIEEPDPAPVALRTGVPAVAVQVAQAQPSLAQPSLAQPSLAQPSLAQPSLASGRAPAAAPAPSQLAAVLPTPPVRLPAKPVQQAAGKPAVAAPAAVQQASIAAPRFAAPVISAASAPISAPQAGQNWIGESVSRASRAHAGPAPYQPAPPYQSAAVVQASAPVPAPSPSPVALPAVGPYQASVLGGARTALPPPVPYGAR